MIERSIWRKVAMAGMLLPLLIAVRGGLAQTPHDAFGIWQHPENGSLIETYPCGGDMCAKIKKIADGQTTDRNNPDEALRGKPIIGLVIVSHATQAGPESWSGKIYNRIDGRTYEGQLTVKGRDRLELTGCTAVIVCRTVTWRRMP